MATKDTARLEARIDKLAGKIDALTLRIDAHLDNHHGPRSNLKLGGTTAIVASLVTAGWEVARRFLLS